MESRSEARVYSGQRASTSASLHVKRSVRCRALRDNAPEGESLCRFPTASVAGQDWRAFRAHLVAWERAARRAAQPRTQLQRPPYPPLVSGDSWAHPLAEPERGCLLLARHDNMKFFSGSVVLIASHDEAVGSLGYVLNKASPLRVRDLQVLGPAEGGFMEAFGSSRLQLGGPVHIDHVTLLHRFRGLRRSQQIAEGMFMGGLPDAIRLIQAGMARPSDFHLALGMSSWAPGQLRAEVAAGHWHLISASPDLVLPAASSPPAACCEPPMSSSSASHAVTCSSSSASPSTHGSHAQQQRTQQQHSGGLDGRCPGRDAAAEGCVAESDGGEQQQQQQQLLADAGSCGVCMYKRIARLAVRGA
ncbi:hypothetical protein Agub_g14127 [Astrephomene gubernaculifera]|uniref:Transcriptional regulator n=1 Tax=Astrephomene gubernaculifera TaxID=47775 RepID=A0AAD3E307_9CHLO|nr:hypothetical protein Agub_g14127 [Astrephomene gubernaculifera]